jgi:hypothetical protein
MHAQLINARLEQIALHAGTRIADRYEITKVNLIDDVTECDANDRPFKFKKDKASD